MIIFILILLIYAASFFAAIGILIYVIGKRKKEKKIEDIKHKEYQDF